MTASSEPEHLEAMLDFLRHSRGFDFTGYKRSTLARRISKRMHEAGITDYAQYTDYLEVHADEFAQLFNTILINVTSFFRYPQAWSVLRTDVLPKLFNGKGDIDPIRVWSAGCASGESTKSSGSTSAYRCSRCVTWSHLSGDANPAGNHRRRHQPPRQEHPLPHQGRAAAHGQRNARRGGIDDGRDDPPGREE